MVGTKSFLLFRHTGKKIVAQFLLANAFFVDDFAKMKFNYKLISKKKKEKTKTPEF